MLTDEQIEQVWEINQICIKCVRSVKYYNAISGSEVEHWSFTQNCYGEIAAISWCHIFNNYKDSTHYSNLFQDDAPLLDEKKYSKTEVLNRILNIAKMTFSEYESFRKEVKSFRNSHAAHWDYEQRKIGITFPDIHKAAEMCLGLREILKELTYNAEQLSEVKKLKTLKGHFEAYDNSHFLDIFSVHADNIKSAL